MRYQRPFTSPVLLLKRIANYDKCATQCQDTSGPCYSDGAYEVDE